MFIFTILGQVGSVHLDIQCDVSTRHPVLGKCVINLKIINLLTYIIINNYLENINLQKISYIYTVMVFTVSCIYIYIISLIYLYL